MSRKKGDREKQIEDSKMRWLTRYTDWAVKRLRFDEFDEASANEFLLKVKAEILKRFPGREKEYFLIYHRRFARILLKRGIIIELYDSNAIN
ncbi:MAG: hypothetical protein H0Z29_11100 [Candidatus Marinimicrobia bacterium]|nr:hypothetical protein [Candidatus Neomarinimicrobiota bacterium]